MDGLNGVDTLPFSIEQLQKEILIEAPVVLVDLASKGLIDLSRITHRIDGIKLNSEDVASNCLVETDECAPHFKIPNVNRFVQNPIHYLGTMDSRLSFKVYFDRDFRFHQYRLATSKKPFAWVSNKADNIGLYDVYLFNLGHYSNLKYVSIDANFENPYDIYKTEYYTQFINTEFYAPAYVQAAIINKKTQQYINYYRQLNKPQKPNTQA